MTVLRKLLPLAVLVAGCAAAWALAQGRPLPGDGGGAVLPPLVRVARLAPDAVQLSVRSHGTVAPRAESDLVPEVSGRVTWVSPALVAGGSFERGEPLLEIDPRDYEIALRHARAALARAESEVRLARAERGRREALADRDVASDAALDQARNAESVARAAREQAAAGLEQAQRDLARTRLSAPFEGRVRDERVAVGQFATRGNPVARLFAVDAAEVRLPVRDADLAYLDLSLGAGADGAPTGPAVILRGRFAGRPREWRGRVVRIESEIDPRSRMHHLVARVEDPYAVPEGGAPLEVGLFVEAEILGRRHDGVLVLPRLALQRGERVLTVDAQDRLHVRSVELLRADGERAYVRASLPADERLCLSSLDAPVEGMRVRSVPADEELGG